MKNNSYLGERIAKVIARSGLSSRREAELIIKSGRVSVNKEIIYSPALNVSAHDRILVDGNTLTFPQETRLWIFHKPRGMICTTKDEKGRKTIFEAFPPDLPRLMNIGRLDLNSEGLLLVTNNGSLKRKLELPKTGWLRKYRVRVRGRASKENMRPLIKGIKVANEKFQPMQITIDRVQGSNSWLTVGLREGKNREIRRAMESIGLTVNRLIRISFGPFTLGSLKPESLKEVEKKCFQVYLDREIFKKNQTY